MRGLPTDSATDREFSIRAIVEEDWRELRELRLEMLRDTPLAFGERLESAQLASEQNWRGRARRGSAADEIAVVAVDSSGRWIGTMRGAEEAESKLMLLGVYVTPAWRGRDAGVTDALLAVVESWARNRGERIMLHVHADNARARRAYAARGYLETGVRLPYPLDPRGTELEMVKTLR